VTDPLRLALGEYKIDIVPAGGDPANPALSGTATVTNDLNASIVAHLTEAGEPALTVFVNDVSPISWRNSRLVVRHTAAAPAVDVALYDDDDADEDALVGVIKGLTNPNEEQLEVRARREYAVTISPADSDEPVFGPAEFKLKKRTSTIYYAIGSLSDGSFELLKQQINLPRARR
jgi:hypothetical protein